MTGRIGTQSGYGPNLSVSLRRRHAVQFVDGKIRPQDGVAESRAGDVRTYASQPFIAPREQVAEQHT